jgi:anti-sigma factor ChrR (cupin superfamily)
MTDPRESPDPELRVQENESESVTSLTAELDVMMASLLTPTSPSPALLARLQATIALPPQRYAPFFSRLAELFDLSEVDVIAQCARLAEPGVWRFAGLPGVRNVQVPGGPRVQGAEVVFARFTPGLYFPAHAHTGLERVLVLEGSYEDSHGVVHRAGELREWQPGSAHAFRVSKQEPCIFASVVFGREFQALTLRLLARALGR